MQLLPPDPLFQVVTLRSTPKPQQLTWLAMHQDYFEGFVGDPTIWMPEEEEAGEIIVRRLIKPEHWGPFEHPQITLAVGGFPHTLMQQARTHRVGISFDVQSFRYTGKRVCAAANGELPPEAIFYLRPIGEYLDREGKHYIYDEARRMRDFEQCCAAAARYAQDLSEGCPEEQARGRLPMDTRQNFVVSFNARSLMHFLDLRAKADAQMEIRQCSAMMFDHFKAWMPLVAEHYETTRYGKARLAP